MRHDHTQYAPLHLILVGAGVVMFAGAWPAPIPAVRVVPYVAGGLVLLLAASFRRLTVRDEVDRLTIGFGPLPLFRRSVPFSDIERAERGRTTWLDGWGVHYLPGRGWTWNLWGYDCVVLHLSGGRTLRVGTDDADGLTAFVTDRLRHENRAAR